MHARFSDPEAAISVSDEVVERFGASDAVHVQAQVAEALILKGQQFEKLGDGDGARAAFDEVAERFADSDGPDLLVKVAKVLTNKPISAGVLRSARVSLDRFEQVVDRSYDKRKVGELLAIRMPLFYKAKMQEALGSSEGQITVLDEVIQRLGATDVPRDLTLVAEALVKKGELLVKLGHDKEALQACEDFDRRLDTMTSKVRVNLRWRMARARIRALLAQGQHLPVLDAFGTAYALFDPRDTKMIEGITECVRELVVAGIDERAVEGILVADREKSGVLDPLVTALRLRTGEEVRAPKEVLEVAADIGEYLEGMGPHPGSR